MANQVLTDRALASDDSTLHTMPPSLAAHSVSVIGDVPLAANSDPLYSAGVAASRSDRGTDFGTSGSGSDGDETIHPSRKRRYRCLADNRRGEADRASRRAERKRLRDTPRIPPSQQQNSPMWEVDRIVAMGCAEDGTPLYKVKWTNTWEHVRNSMDRIVVMGRGGDVTVLYEVKWTNKRECVAKSLVWEVDRIVAMGRAGDGTPLCKVKWTNTWERVENLLGSADTAIAEFHVRDTGIFEE